MTQRYPTAGGRTVTWTPQPDALAVESAPDLDLGLWRCSGCNESGLGEQSQAKAHADGCHTSDDLLVRVYGKGL